MPIAKEVLRIGFTVVALPGGYVTKDAVKQYGWGDVTDDGPDIVSPQEDDQAAKARKGGTAK